MREEERERIIDPRAVYPRAFAKSFAINCPPPLFFFSLIVGELSYCNLFLVSFLPSVEEFSYHRT